MLRLKMTLQSVEPSKGNFFLLRAYPARVQFTQNAALYMPFELRPFREVCLWLLAFWALEGCGIHELLDRDAAVLPQLSKRSRRHSESNLLTGA